MFLEHLLVHTLFLEPAILNIMVLMSTIMPDTSVLKVSSREGLGYSTWKYRLFYHYFGHSQVFSKFSESLRTHEKQL